ncbi:MAG: hypothetical protein CMJ49_06950 [Planctomycetaceae bacterium]|nr:hypothetical protein [Planctomycetaceae bacterium]
MAMWMTQTVPLVLADGGDAGSRSATEWLLGLDRLRLSGETLELGWRFPLPAWVWALMVLVIAALAWLGYRRMIGRAGGRAVLGVTRGLIVLCVAALLAGPMLVLPREHIERDQVLMLVDRSASMTFADVIDPTAAGGRSTREAQLRAALLEHESAWQSIATEHQIHWWTFADAVQPIGSPDDLLEPDGPATAMRSALDVALRRTTGKPISAIVVFSDGRSTEKVGAETLQQLSHRAAQVIAVPLGSPTTPIDTAIGRVDAPQRAFINDNVPVIVHLNRTGDDPDGLMPRGGAMVRLIDQQTQQVLDEEAVGPWDQPVALSASVEAAGPVTWRVVLDAGDDELIRENNTQDIGLTLVDRAIRLLYVEGYPRWDYRFLRSLLVREDSVDASVMLVSSDRAFAAEGDIPLQSVPRVAEDWQPFDVIVVGDVSPDFFGEVSLRHLREHVADRGAGLLYLGGQHAMPTAYVSGALADLLPMRSPSSVSRWPVEVTARPTRAADVLGVLRLQSPFGEPGEMWPAELPTLRWGQSLGALKPAAEVLAMAEPIDEPLLVRMRYGAGQVLYLSTDEIWRWRYEHGELYPQQFWMQVIRLLGRGRIQSEMGAESRLRFDVSHRRASVGDTLVIELDVSDQSLLVAERRAMTAHVREVGGTRSADQSLVLQATDRAGRFRGTWQPRRPGQFDVALDDPMLAELSISRRVEVRRTADETRNPGTDHPLLASLAEATGGRVLAIDKLGQLPQLLPDNARRTAADISESLTTSPLAFGLVLGLLILEWVGRKLMRYA